MRLSFNDTFECCVDCVGGTDVINVMAYSPFSGGPVTIDHENVVKAYSVVPSMLGRGHTLLEPLGPVWVRHSFFVFSRFRCVDWGVDV